VAFEIATRRSTWTAILRTVVPAQKVQSTHTADWTEATSDGLQSRVQWFKCARSAARRDDTQTAWHKA